MANNVRCQGWQRVVQRLHLMLEADFGFLPDIIALDFPVLIHLLNGGGFNFGSRRWWFNLVCFTLRIGLSADLE